MHVRRALATIWNHGCPSYRPIPNHVSSTEPLPLPASCTASIVVVAVSWLNCRCHTRQLPCVFRLWLGQMGGIRARCGRENWEAYLGSLITISTAFAPVYNFAAKRRVLQQRAADWQCNDYNYDSDFESAVVRL